MDAYKIWQFRKIVQTSDPWGANLWPKFEILTVLGAVFSHFCPNKREIWYGGADLLSAPPCQISRLSGQRVAPAGRNLFLDYWVKQYRHGCALRRPAGNKCTKYWHYKSATTTSYKLQEIQVNSDLGASYEERPLYSRIKCNRKMSPSEPRVCDEGFVRVSSTPRTFFEKSSYFRSEVHVTSTLSP